MTDQEVREINTQIFQLVQKLDRKQRIYLAERILPMSETCTDNDGQVVIYTGWQEEECK